MMMKAVMQRTMVLRPPGCQPWGCLHTTYPPSNHKHCIHTIIHVHMYMYIALSVCVCVFLDWCSRLSQRSNEVNIDSHPESVAYVEGSGSVHVLFNFLLTSKTTITTTGAQAGIPPTILSPVGFQGATLKALKVDRQ